MQSNKTLTCNLDSLDDLVGTVVDRNMDRNSFSMVVNLNQKKVGGRMPRPKSRIFISLKLLLSRLPCLPTQVKTSVKRGYQRGSNVRDRI